jgi:hypothetical protein
MNIRGMLTEGLVIVMSILIAFSIDAWWDSYQEQRREYEILVGLHADFHASRPGLESRLELARRMASGTGELLHLTRDRQIPGPVSVPDPLVLAVLGGPTYEPAMSTLDSAIASGEIELLRDDKLRFELANWRRILSDTAEDEREVRRITNEQLIPLLSRSLDLRPFFDTLLSWSGGDPHAAGRLMKDRSQSVPEGVTALIVDTELVAVLSMRKFYVEFAAADLEELLASLDRSVGLLDLELER